MLISITFFTVCEAANKQVIKQAKIKKRTLVLFFVWEHTGTAAVAGTQGFQGISLAGKITYVELP